MKKILFLIILSIFFISCSDEESSQQLDPRKEFKKQMEEKYSGQDIEIVNDNVFVTVGYYKNNNNNRSFTIYTNSLAENELLLVARKQAHTDFRQTIVHFFNDYNKTVYNSNSSVNGGMYLSNYNKEAKFAEYRKSNIKDEFGNIVVKESIFYFKNGNDNTYHDRSNYTNGIKDK
ncbi:MAG: hypothetical protein ACRCX2_09105 [Paraclostridium sp.]